MLRKMFGGIRMTWRTLILFAILSGIVTGLIALLVPDGNSLRQIAVTFEAWIVLAILVVVNCEKPMEAACKTFVYFLISQPLVYLVQVPFNSMGFGLFQYYYPYWFYWTLATFPGAFLAWHIRRDDGIAAVILSVALAMLVLLGTGYLRDLIRQPPKFLLSTLFCYVSVPLLILCILHKRNPRLIASGIAVLALAVCLFLQFRAGSDANAYGTSFGLDSTVYPVTSEWKVRLADPENGTASLFVGDDVVGSSVTVSIHDPNRSADVILTDPEGNDHLFPAEVIRDGNGNPTFLYGRD